MAETLEQTAKKILKMVPKLNARKLRELEIHAADNIEKFMGLSARAKKAGDRQSAKGYEKIADIWMDVSAAVENASFEKRGMGGML